MEDAVSDFGGNLLFVSHDRYFINKFATRIWMLENGQITDFKGTYEEYRAWRKRQEELKGVLSPKNKGVGAGVPDGPPTKASGTAKEKPRRPGGTKELEKQVAAAERAVEKAEIRLDELSQAAEEFASDYLKLQEIYQEREAAEDELAHLYANWERLAVELEEARG